MSVLHQLLTNLLSIPSPTGQELQKMTFIKDWVQRHAPSVCVLADTEDGLIFSGAQSHQKGPHVVLVGHSDVVPQHRVPKQVDDQLFGSGASDMQAGLVASLVSFVNLLTTHSLSLIVYNREENTPLVDNGLYGLRHSHPDFFDRIDLAIIAEPTNNTIQLGCVGSMHFKVRVVGQAAHSARPWDGDHALYKALPLIQGLANHAPIAHTLMGVTFHDVMHITESHCEPGKTTIPGFWEANINYRYAPIRSSDEAEQVGHDIIETFVPTAEIHLNDHAPAGCVVDTPLLQRFIQSTRCSIESKQAWTDVAQFAQLGIAAVNYGPGLTAQAHRPDEYVRLSDLDVFYETLTQALTDSLEP